MLAEQGVFAERVGHDEGQVESRQRCERRRVEAQQRQRPPGEQQQETQREGEADGAELHGDVQVAVVEVLHFRPDDVLQIRSEEHTSALQSLMRISYAVFCLKKK